MSDRIALNLRTDLTHPFLLGSEADLKRLPEKIKAQPTEAHYLDMIARLEKHLDDDVPDYPGDSASQHDRYYEIVHLYPPLAVDAAVAWWCDGDERWLALASRIAAGFARWAHWRAPKHLPLPADLSSATLGLQMGLVYDLLYHQLAQPVREAIADAMLRHVVHHVQPQRIDRCWWSWAYDGNWSWVVLGGNGAGALAICPERPDETRTALETVAGHLQRSIDHLRTDGSWREGVSYCMYGLSNAMVFLEGLAHAGDGYLAAHPSLDALDDFALLTMIAPHTPPNFGDSGHTAGAHPVMYARAARARRADMQHFCDTQGAAGALAIAYRDPALAATPAQFDPPSRCWPEIGWAVMRSKWGDDNALVLAAKAGSVAGGHQHWDCGTFILRAFGDELIGEPGIGVYSREYHSGRPLLKTTAAHNCMTFDEQEQQPDEFFESYITQFETRPGYDMVKMALTHGYDHPDVMRYNRLFFLLRPGVVVLVDEVRARCGHNSTVGTMLQSRLHTFGRITLRDFDAVVQTDRAAMIVRNIMPPSTVGLGDWYAAYSVGKHEGLTSRRDQGQDDRLKYLNIRMQAARDPAIIVTLLTPGRTVAEAEDILKQVHVQDQRRHRLEICHGDQTLVLDWGNRRWELYWNILPGPLPRLIEATPGGPYV